MEKVERIDKSTPEQEARIPSWVNEWIAKGLTTERADRVAFEKAAAECYQHAGLPWPGEVIWVENPLEGALTAPRIHYERLCKETGETPTKDGVKKAITEDWTKYLGGSWWLSWQAFEGYFRQVCNLTLGKELDSAADAYARAQMASGWWWPYSTFVVACEHPTKIMLEEIGPQGWGSHRLHCSSGPAIEWKNWSLYFWHGVEVPAEWIEAPNTIDPATVLQAENLEQRRAGCEIIGWVRLLESLHAKVIDEDADPQIGILYEIDLPDSPGSRILKVVCGTGRVFGIMVPPSCKTAREANASTYNLPTINPEIRT